MAKEAASGKRPKSRKQPKYGPEVGDKVERALHEMKHGELESGTSGKKVTDPKQAIAIGIAEARREGARAPQK
jgi:hypothetical protein